MIGKKMYVVLSVLLVFAFSVPALAGVTVYAEGAYTETDLAVYIYADISGDAILSAGVKLTYTAELTLTSAAKNEDVWYMGDGSSNEAYMDPDTSVAGEVIIICGKLDTNDGHALDGVSGDRVLLGILRFDRTDSAMPFAPALTIDYGKAAPYDNFVETDGTVLDSVNVTFGAITVRERGDANVDGVITSADMFVIKGIMSTSGDYTCFADCNDDLVITSADMFCVKGKL